VNQIDLPLALFGTQVLPSPLALFLTVVFVVFLFRRDIRERPEVTGALWLPIVWMLIVCSRPVSEWLRIIGLPLGGGVSLEEGSPLDACVYFGLIAIGLYMLTKRQVNLSVVIQKNGWLMVFLLYCFIAILWSDFPLVAFKRWIKILGLPIMGLIVLSEPNFEEAFARLMKRSAYVLVPFSILLIKYYPGIGRRFDVWSGLPTNSGVTQGKNILGCVCWLFGLFFFWLLLQTWRTERSKERRRELLLILGFLLMISYLFHMAHSATALVCLLVGVMVMLSLGRRWMDKRLIGVYALLAAIVLLAAQLLFGISAYAVELLHKDPTLTDRTILWEDLLKQKTNPIFGVGFESFWLGDRLEKLHEGRSFQPSEAHNGYLETYLNLGLVGLLILAGLLIATFLKICREIVTNFQFGRFRLAFFSALILYNWTEVSFRGPHVLWLVFYIIAIEYPKPKYETVLESSEVTRPEEEMELGYFPEMVGNR
jgi:exopolysaccharide production protein ExoQ